MSFQALPLLFVYLVVAICVVHISAIIFGWYQSMPYIDIPLHAAGGFWAGGVGLWAYYVLGKTTSKRLVLSMFLAILIAAGIGFLWEIFEFVTNMMFAQEPFNVLDTLGDMVCDIIGGACAGWYIARKS